MLADIKRKLKSNIENDENTRKARHYGSRIIRSTPSFLRDYLLEKVPVIEWLPHYDPKWIINDLVAGITIGVLLVPQSLAYAKVANIPGEYGLISSWLPTVLYAVMGTSKDTTSGPTAIMALLTGEIVNDYTKEGYAGHEIATAVAFFVGIYSLAIGMFKLGFILDFIPLPVLTGYVSAAALTIIFGQIPPIFGEKNIGSATGRIIHDFFVKLPKTQWRTFLVGISGILFLGIFQWAGRRFGKKYRSVWFLSICRNALLLILFTGISYACNKNRKATPLFEITKTVGSGLKSPKVPELGLLKKVGGRSVAVFLAAALEHLAIGKSFGRRHNYVINESQELCFIGVSNLVGSFLGAMPITGGFSRTAVNSESGVKSPLSGLVTTACVLVSIYKLTGAFYWIPKATLSAIIVVAVWQIVIPVKVFYTYWQISFIDFIASMVSFWVTLFVSVEIGIAAAVSFSVAYILLRIAFTQVTPLKAEDIARSSPLSYMAPESASNISDDTIVIRINESVLYPNAYRIKSQIMDLVQISHDRINSNLEAERKERLWNETGEKRISKLRRSANRPGPLPLLRVIILDITRMTRLDTTGLQMFLDLKSELHLYAGDILSIKFVGMNDDVRKRFERARWELLHKSYYTDGEEKGQPVRDGGDLVFEAIQTALLDDRHRGEQTSSESQGLQKRDFEIIAEP